MSPDESGNVPTAVSVMTGSPPTAANDPHGDKQRFQPRGNDWAIGRKSPRAVPIRRTIHVVVRRDQIAILPENTAQTDSAADGIVVPMKGDTVESLDEFVDQVRKHVDGWGIAGDNLYWRPVLLLSVGPEGQRRADDLTRLLKNSGLEFRANETAQNTKQGEADETR